MLSRRSFSVESYPIALPRGSRLVSEITARHDRTGASACVRPSASRVFSSGHNPYMPMPILTMSICVSGNTSVGPDAPLWRSGFTPSACIASVQTANDFSCLRVYPGEAGSFPCARWVKRPSTMTRFVSRFFFMKPRTDGISADVNPWRPRPVSTLIWILSGRG